MLTEDTKILTVYSGPVKIKDLLNQPEIIFIFNPISKLMEISSLLDTHLLKLNSKLVEVEFDSGLKVKCDLEQEFYLFRGNPVKVTDLKIGQSIRAFSLSLAKDGHYRIHGWVDGKAKHQYLSRMIWEYFYGKIEPGKILHHKDFNKLNNNLENFILLDNAEHASVHYPYRKDKRNHKIVSINYLEEKGQVFSLGLRSYIIADNEPTCGIYTGIVGG